jgi:cellulose synthase/poly-beta-1,6-N-acetylglucosamine synthase-like glycosyltransferase
LLGPLAALATLLVALTSAIALLEAVCIAGLGATVAPSLHVAVFFVAYDLATGTVLLLAASRRLARDRAAARATTGDRTAAAPPISVLIAAYNEVGDGEAHGVVATVRALASQRGVPFEILVGDDGSHDGTYDAVVGAFALHATEDGHQGSILRSDGTHATLRVFRFAHAGKGATLNALAARAAHGVFVTMDADTTPAAGALASLAEAFLDEQVESAAGVVSVRNARSILTRHQYAEYIKNSIVRIAWSALGGLEQVPGAFAGVRAASFRAVGGFPTDSLTEDYELTYRLVDRGCALGRPPLVVTVPRAQAFTDVPTTLRGFVRQRTRWFAGFLSTLYRFRHLIGRSAAGGFGVVRLPLKVIDAVLPLIAFASLIVIARGVASPLLSLSRVALGIFLVRWVWDLTFYAVALRLARELGSPEETSRVAPPLLQGWMCTATEALTYVWLKHAAVLRAYGWAARRVRTWEPSREAVMKPTP